MNYMDYTNDACMYMITEGQATRMSNYVSSSLQNLVTNASNVCEEGAGGGGSGGGGNTPTCDDGIQNGQETGVDCGGPDCEPCETEATCGDGIQNGNETGIDCGGPDCPPCQTDGICEAPQSSSVEELSDTKVKVSWNTVPDAIKYKIAYRPVGGGSWIRKNTIQPFKVLNNLTAGVEYQFKLKTKCPNGWTAWGAIDTFTIGEDGGGECPNTTIVFELVLDDYGSETSWELVDENYNVIAVGGPYQDGNEGQVINEEFCLEDGCYSLFVDDAYGDGICCDYGEGFFTIQDEFGNVLNYSDGYFGSYDVLDFCIDDNGFRKKDERKDDKKANLARKPYGSKY